MIGLFIVALLFWQKLDQSNTVTSVNGQVGAVTLTAANVGAPQTDGTGATGTWGINISGTATSATNVAGGGANRIVYNTGSGATDFLVAPTVTGHIFKMER